MDELDAMQRYTLDLCRASQKSCAVKSLNWVTPPPSPFQTPHSFIPAHSPHSHLPPHRLEALAFRGLLCWHHLDKEIDGSPCGQRTDSIGVQAACAVQVPKPSSHSYSNAQVQQQATVLLIGHEPHIPELALILMSIY